MDTMALGRRGVIIAQALWPDLMPVADGSQADREGVDMLSLYSNVQVKTDRRIAESGNIELEVFERSPGPGQRWRATLAKVEEYVFITNGFAVRVSIDELAVASRNQPLRKVSETSMGFLIPIEALNHATKLQHHYILAEP